MKILESLKKRRTYYNIEKSLPVDEKEVFDLIKKSAELVPDAYNMKSSRIVVVTGKNQDVLWDEIYNVFQGKVDREKIDGFKSGYGTILYFYDNEVVEKMQSEFPLYAEKFPHWATQSVGMLQLSIWAGLRELEIGASLQHYNPVIDDAVKKLFDIPESYVLDAQMPFGSISKEVEPKPSEDISKRVRIIK